MKTLGSYKYLIGRNLCIKSISINGINAFVVIFIDYTTVSQKSSVKSWIPLNREPLNRERIVVYCFCTWLYC